MPLNIQYECAQIIADSLSPCLKRDPVKCRRNGCTCKVELIIYFIRKGAFQQKEELTFSCILLQNGQTYFTNLAL